MSTNIRAVAAKIIFQIIEQGRSLSDSLPEFSSDFKDVRDQALLQAICYGVCRDYFRLDYIAQSLLTKPLRSKDQDIYALILVGLYQLIGMRIPEYAAVTETVAATKNLKKIWAKALVNGVLREYLRNPILTENVIESPKWLSDKLKKDYPNDWENIISASLQHPPFSLRVNQQKITIEKYLKKLSDIKMDAKPIVETTSGIILENPVDVKLLPGFFQGEVSVQDGAAQLAAELIQLEPNQRVLDACAAPGGKTAHMLEIQPSIDCIAVDQDEKRMQSVKENLDRLKLAAKCIVADAGDITKWWDGKLFDRILLDAPCSASGVIHRHPDIKLLRRESDIPKLAATQLRLLNSLWPLLKTGGILLYATCSIFPEENSQIIEEFLKDHPQAREEKINKSWGIECSRGKQILPGMQNMDGFYFACLRK